MHVKTYNKRKGMIEESDQVKIKLPEEKQPHPLHPEAPAAWGLVGARICYVFKKVKDEKDQQLCGEEAVKDHL